MFRRVFWVLLYLFIIALLLSAAKGETSDEDGHEQDEHEHEDDEGHELWETASVYSLEANSYTATISTVDGELMTEDGFAFMVFSTSSADDSGLEEAEEIAAAGVTFRRMAAAAAAAAQNPQFQAMPFVSWILRAIFTFIPWTTSWFEVSEALSNVEDKRISDGAFGDKVDMVFSVLEERSRTYASKSPAVLKQKGAAVKESGDIISVDDEGAQLTKSLERSGEESDDLAGNMNLRGAVAEENNTSDHEIDAAEEAAYLHPSGEEVSHGQPIESRRGQLDATQVLVPWNRSDDDPSRSATSFTQANASGLSLNRGGGDYGPARQERFEWVHRFATSKQETFHVEDGQIRLLVIPSGSERQPFAGPISVVMGSHLVFCNGYFLVSTIVDCQPSGTRFEKPLFLDFCVGHLSDGEWDSIGLHDDREKALEMRKENLREEIKVIWQEESHLPWRRFDECNTDILFEDGIVFLRARIYHFSGFALGRRVNMEAPYHEEKISYWFWRRPREICFGNATDREIMFLIMPTSCINWETINPSFHSDVFSYASIIALPPKRGEAGGAYPYNTISLLEYPTNEVMVSLLTYGGNELRVWDFRPVKGNTRVVALPGVFEHGEPRLGAHTCYVASDIKRVALKAILKTNVVYEAMKAASLFLPASISRIMAGAIALTEAGLVQETFELTPPPCGDSLFGTAGTGETDAQKEDGDSPLSSGVAVRNEPSVESSGGKVDSSEKPEPQDEGQDELSHQTTAIMQAGALESSSSPRLEDDIPAQQGGREFVHQFDTSREETFYTEDGEVRLRVVPSSSQRQQFAGPISVDVGGYLVFCDGYFLVSTIVDCEPPGTRFEEPLFLDFPLEDVSNEEWDSFELDDERRKELDACKENLRQEFKILWQEESSPTWRRLDECETDILIEDGTFFLRARVSHFSRWALGKEVNMEASEHLDKIVLWRFGRQRREIHFWNATERKIMFIIFPTSFIMKATESIDTGVSVTESPSIHLAVSRAFDYALLESGLDPQIKPLPRKREEAGGNCPHVVVSLATHTAKEAMVSLMTYDANELSVWDYQRVQGNTRFVVLPRRFECGEPLLGVHSCVEGSDLRRLALQAIVGRLPRAEIVARITNRG